MNPAAAPFENAPLENVAAEIASALLALDIPGECLPGVAANLAMLAVHARRVAAEKPA